MFRPFPEPVIHSSISAVGCFFIIISTEGLRYIKKSVGIGELSGFAKLFLADLFVLFIFGSLIVSALPIHSHSSGGWLFTKISWSTAMCAAINLAKPLGAGPRPAPLATAISLLAFLLKLRKGWFIQLFLSPASKCLIKDKLRLVPRANKYGVLCCIFLRRFHINLFIAAAVNTCKYYHVLIHICDCYLKLHLISIGSFKLSLVWVNGRYVSWTNYWKPNRVDLIIFFWKFLFFTNFKRV